ncbi:hypothetical protein QR98_0096810 [Sarcoptes scabiei]|uniref:Aldehyde dehydrogenase domain-containing protein n=1 Tax=Sarcoptes scabiei TaxID=52283 RepID=A0A132AJE3_SARSC|nr:hypothetical protein QR98_0096810 [Sarcoptes scabiei]
MNTVSIVEFTQLFIGGKFFDSNPKRSFSTINPFDGKVIANIQQASLDDINLTVQVARKRFEDWSQTSPSVRGRFLYKLANLFDENIERIASLDSLENGIPITEMIHCTRAAAEILRFYAGAVDKIKGETLPMDQQRWTMTVREPLGVCAIIIPWNSPTLMLAKTIGPALATGNTVIVKPAEQTSLSALFIAHLTTLAGLPGGVFNVLTGDGPNVGAHLASHMDIDMITFTGSLEVGRKIMAASAESNLKKVTLELGGKSPLVIFDDVDVEKAAQLSSNAIFVSNGQVCCCGSRTYVHEKIYDRFLKECVKLAENRIVGDPMDPKTQHGPQVDESAVEKIMTMIRSGLNQGALLMTGGKKGLKKSLSNGIDDYFIQPTVFANVDESMSIGQEEIFGPVQSIIKFSSLDEIIERANKTKFGLAAGIITNDINKALKFARSVRAGTCWINCYFVVRPSTPFGGYKLSGVGREFGEEALRQYTETKTITINLDESNYLFG